MKNLFSTAVLLILSVCLLASGCTKKETIADINKMNIQKVHMFYKIYMFGNNMTGPPNQEKLVDFLRTDNTAKVRLDRLGVNPDNLEDYFISERDEEPFEIRWGLTGTIDHAIVFEKVGVDGKRFISFATPVEAGESDYNDYLSGKKLGAAPPSDNVIPSEPITENE